MQHIFMLACLKNRRQMQLGEHLLISKVDSDYSLMSWSIIEAYFGKHFIDGGRFQLNLLHLAFELPNIPFGRLAMTHKNSLPLGVNGFFLIHCTVDFITHLAVTISRPSYRNLFMLRNHHSS